MKITNHMPWNDVYCCVYVLISFSIRIFRYKDIVNEVWKQIYYSDRNRCFSCKFNSFLWSFIFRLQIPVYQEKRLLKTVSEEKVPYLRYELICRGYFIRKEEILIAQVLIYFNSTRCYDKEPNKAKMCNRMEL